MLLPTKTVATLTASLSTLNMAQNPLPPAAATPPPTTTLKTASLSAIAPSSSSPNSPGLAALNSAPNHRQDGPGAVQVLSTLGAIATLIVVARLSARYKPHSAPENSSHPHSSSVEGHAGSSSATQWMRDLTFCLLPRSAPQVPALDLMQFQRFAAELDYFNKLNSDLSGLCSEGSVAHRRGRAAAFPELPYHLAFARAWNDFLNPRGFILHLAAQEASGKGDGAAVMHAQFSLRIANLEQAAVVLEQLVPICYAERLSPRLNNLLRHIEASCEAFATRGDFKAGFWSNRRWRQELKALQTSLSHLGRRSIVGELHFLENLIAEAPDLFARYTSMLRVTCNEEVGGDRFWVAPHNLADAFFATEKAIREFRRTAPVVSATTERMLERLRHCLDRLSIEFRPIEDDPVEVDSGGDTAVSEQPRPYQQSGYTEKSLENFYEHLESLERLDARINGSYSPLRIFSDPRSLRQFDSHSEESP